MLDRRSLTYCENVATGRVPTAQTHRDHRWKPSPIVAREHRNEEAPFQEFLLIADEPLVAANATESLLALIRMVARSA
jgi:hypothetical protein